MKEYNLYNKEGEVIKRYGYTCQNCNKVYSSLFLRYAKKFFICECGMELRNPER